MTKNTYIIAGVVIVILAGVLYFMSSGEQDISGVASVTENTNSVSNTAGATNNAGNTTNSANSSTGTSTITKNTVIESKPAGSVFKCDGGKTMNGSFIFTGTPRAELELIDAKGNKRSLTLPQDLTVGKPVFKSKDGSVVLINKGDGSVSLQENGVVTFANCKAQ